MNQKCLLQFKFFYNNIHQDFQFNYWKKLRAYRFDFQMPNSVTMHQLSALVLQKEIYNGIPNINARRLLRKRLHLKAYKHS
jgi:hypothetical protein